MNISHLVTKIKFQLGLVNVATVFPDLDNTIIYIIENFTLPTYSRWQPIKEVQNLNTSELVQLDKGSNWVKYLLNDPAPRKLLYVLDIRYRESMVSGMGLGSTMSLMQGDYMQQVMLSNANMSLMNQVLPKFTFEFREPLELILYNSFTSYKYDIEYGFEHQSVLTVPETCMDSFTQLALLDVKYNLLPTMKQFNNINTAHGTISLNLDSWENAEGERKEFVEKYDSTYHMDLLKPFYWG